MKKFSYLFFTMILMVIFTSDYQALDTTQKVYDYANILTDSEEALLKQKIDDYIEEYNMDMVLVSVDEHNKYNTQAYADDFYDYNGFGIGDTYDGVIFVVDFNFGYTDMYMSTTGEAIRMYDDDRIDKILDVVYEEYDYYQMYADFIEESSYYASLGVPSSNKNTYINSSGDLVYKRSFPWFSSILISSIISTVVLLILIAKNKMVKKATEANVYLNKESLNITERTDNFITTHTTSVRINTSSGGGGGRVGGSSTHRSSSGRSHGGGGRRR